MATAKRLPSGSYRCRIYSYTDSNGKKHYESFTAPTKAQAEQLAAQFANSADKKRAADITVSEAINNYINSNDSTLSPSTVGGYISDAKRLEPLGNIKIRKLTSKILQDFISELNNRGLSPKTVKNTYSLLRSSLTFSGMDADFSIHLPKSKKERTRAPESEQIEALYNNASRKMKIAIALASRHSLRRGEISALKFGDIEGNTIYVHADMVRDFKRKCWVYKEIPKTETSNRIVYLSDAELELIGTGNPKDYILDLVPGSIGTNFHNLKHKLGLGDIRFHDLRVYFASISAAMGIPEIYTSHHGGWKEGSKVLHAHYQKPIASFDEHYANKLNNYFESMTQDMTRKI